VPNTCSTVKTTCKNFAMSNELGEDWTSDVGLTQWHRAEIGPDDRTVTVHFGAAFSEDEAEPRLTAELSSDAVLIGLRLEPIVFNTSFSSWTNGPSHHAIEIVLAEPVAGRPIVDAWRPPPPPPPVRKTI